MNERPMNEKERISVLLEEGKINQEEADLLLEALDEADTAEAMADEMMTDEVMANEETLNAFESETHATPIAPEPPEPAAPPKPSAGAEATTTPGRARRWLRVSMMAKNLEIRCKEGLSEPQVSGAELEREGEHWAIHAKGIESLLSGPGQVTVTLPPDCGVDLTAKAGNIDIIGAAFVRGRAVAGNLDLKDIGGIDLELKAGNLDATLHLTEGQHRVRVSMGNADIALLRGSSVKLSARVTMGALNIDGPKQLGDGRASLDLAAKMGNLDVRVPRE